MSDNYFKRRFWNVLSLLLILVFASINTSMGQDIIKAKDLTQIHVDQLSDADILKIKGQLESSNMTFDQAEQLLLAKGMPNSEVIKLRQRLSALDQTKPNSPSRLRTPSPNKTAVNGRNNNALDTLDKAQYDKKPQPLINPLIFGSELYTSVSPSFEPNTNIATPVNYILGPSDQVQVSVYGVQVYEGELTVSPDGLISIPSVGQIKVAGLTIEAATQKLKTVMGNSAYPYLKTGGSKLSLTLSNIRSIKVTVIGSSRPANYTVSSLSTVFNVLYIAGGPSEFGSFRQIELWRNNKLERTIDLYHLLLHGDQSDNVGLKDNDVILIPSYKTRVELQGQIKRPGIFEVLPGENFSNILEFASGFTDTAYRASVKVFQRSDRERKVFDLSSSLYNSYHPISGDVFVISKTLNRFQNRVRISGAVFRPDTYELTPGLTVADLIRRADGLTEDAFTGRAQIIRLEEDLTRGILSFDIKRALRNEPADNIVLKREDEVLISSVQELKDTFKVTIQGEVRVPGLYDYVQNLTLKDLILQAGGFTDAANKNIEIARLVKRDSLTAADPRANMIINVSIDNDLTSATSNAPLQPFDLVTVRRKAGYIQPETVIINGQVQFPGPYAIGNRSENVSALIKRAGGFTPEAYPEGAYIKRKITEVEKQKSEEDVQKLQKKIKDTVAAKDEVVEDARRTYDKIPLDLVAILKNPGSAEDISLKAGDELYIPKYDAQVKVIGNVLLTTQLPYEESRSFTDYIAAAGGYGGNAWRKKSFIVYANGKAATTKHFLFFKFYPQVRPGSTLIVPAKPEKKGLNTGEVIGIASALASLAGVVIAILRL